MSWKSFGWVLGGLATVVCSFTASAAPVSVPDNNLEQALEEALGLTVTIDGVIDDAEFVGFTEFEARSKGIVDLTGLEAATDLTTLNLRDNDIVSVSALSGLTGLTTLDLGFNAITDVTPLGGLTALTYLELGFGNPLAEQGDDGGPDPFANANQITDLSPLATLVNLEYLNIVGNQTLTDISVLSSLTSLNSLWMGGGAIADFSPLTSRAGTLGFLAIVNTGTLDNADMTIVNGLTNLNAFAMLAEANVTDISALTAINPSIFIAFFTGLTSVEVFATYSNMTTCIIGGNPLTSLDGFEGAVNLEDAQLSQNQLTDIDALEGLTSLRSLQLDQNQLVNIDALESLTGLEDLRLDENLITSLTPLVDNAGLGGDDQLSIRDNPLSETAICDELPVLRAKFTNEFNVQGDYFCGPTFNLTINIIGTGNSFPSAGVTAFPQNEQVFINAFPSAGSGFAYSQMTGDVVTNENFAPLLMNSDKTVNIEFVNTGTLRTLTLQTSGPGDGSLTPGVGVFSYLDGSEATIFANTNDAFFAGWSGDLVSVIPSATLVMDADKSVTGAFATTGFTLSMGVSGAGNVSPPQGNYQLATGLVVPIQAFNNGNSTFINWTGEVADSGAAETTVTMDGPRNVVANFQTGTIALNISSTGGGSTNPGTGTTFFQENEQTTVVAIPGANAAFDRWVGDIGGADQFNPVLNLTMSQERTIQAQFVTADFSLTIDVSGDGSTNPAPGTYGYLNGQVANVNAVQSGGDAFSNWTGDLGGANPNSQSIQLTMNQNRTITANFVEVDVFLTVNAPTGSGTTTPPAGLYGYVSGTLATVLAKPNTGSRFVGWGGGDFDGTLPTAVLFMDQNKQLTAIFEVFPATPITFNDANFEAAVRTLISKPTGDIFPADVTVVGQLQLGNANIADLTGLQYFNQTSRFNGFNNDFTDISEVAGLTSLDASDIASNAVTDITPYNGLPFLRELNFGANNVTDISGLDTLPSLESFTAFENGISDISTLSNFRLLKRLNLNANNVTDISPLAGLTLMTSIRMQNNDVQSLAPLASLTALEVLDMSGSGAISDISPLANLTSLTQIELSRCDITDISVLEDLPNLEQVSLTDNNITDLTPLVNNAGFATGDFLFIGNNPLSPDAQCTQVATLTDRGVTVVGAFCDNNPPVITLLGEATVEVLEGDAYTDAGATAFDNEDGTLTANIVTTNPVDTSIPAVYIVRYNVQDSAGNDAVEVTRTVTVLSGDLNPLPIDLQVLVPEFDDADTDSSGGLDLAELQAILPGASQNDLDELDINNDGEIQVSELIVASAPGEIYTADQDANNEVSLSELLRVIQFYNTGGYQCSSGTEDGYAPGAGPQDCLRYAADLDVDFEISLSELLRVIQFYNIGGYNFCPETLSEDGYCVGLP